MNADIIVVGGGIIGASFALQSNFQIVVVDRHPPPVVALDGEFDHRVYALTPTNMDLLQRLDLFQPADRARLGPIRAMEIFSDKQAKLAFSARDAQRSELAVMIEHGLLARRLTDKLGVANHVHYISDGVPKSVDIRADGVSLTLEDGTKINANLLVGADGANSWVRDESGFSMREKDYEQIALVANFRCEKNHEQIARQWFAEGRILAWLPLPDNIISIVWSLPLVRAEELSLQTSDAFSRAVAEAGMNHLGAMKLLSPIARFPLRSLRSDRVAGLRVALIGDAAHTIHPLAGQGLNLGLQDATALTQVLQKKSAAEGVGDLAVLRRYERSRKESVAAMHAVTDGLHGLFATDSALSVALRNGGLGVADKFPWLKKMLVARAIG